MRRTNVLERPLFIDGARRYPSLTGERIERNTVKRWALERRPDVVMLSGFNAEPKNPEYVVKRYDRFPRADFQK